MPKKKLMRAIRIHQHGGPEVLKIDSDLPIPKPGPGEVLLQIKATAMNHMDIWVRQGMPGVKIPLPIILGCEGSGIIKECGAEIKNYSVGDEVILSPGTSCGRCEMCLSDQDNFCRSYGIYGETEDGTQVEYKVVSESQLIKKPKNLSFEEAAAMPLTFMTAWQMLVDRGGVKPGQDVLILAAASGVGSAGVQIAKLFGARVIATVGSDEKMERVKELGADDVINHSKQDFSQEVKKLTNKRGVDIVFEHVGQATWEKSLRALAFAGKLVTCGATTGHEVKIDLRHLFMKQQQIIGSTMGSKSTLFKIMKLASEKRLKPVIDRTFPFSEVMQAHQRLSLRSTFGKVVLLP